MNVTMIVGLLGFASLGCSRASPDERVAVEFPFSPHTIHRAPVGTQVTVLEIGSLACEFCREFHDSVLPRLLAESLKTSRSPGYLFVSVDSFSPLLEASASARCIAQEVGALAALDAGFAMADSLAGSAASGEPAPSPPPMDMCSSTQRNTVLSDARRAARFGIRAIPTFVIGVNSGSSVRGWVVEGLRVELILATLDSVRARLAESVAGAQ